MKIPKCSFCDREAVYTYGENYCEYHFFRYIEKKVWKNIREWKMIEPGDKIAVAVSGGKDSLTLLYLLKKFRDKFKNFELVVLFVDEGASSRIEDYKNILNFFEKFGKEEFVKISFKEELGFSLPEIVDLFPGPCTICGVLRRYLLNKKAKELGCTKIAVGHNLDDFVQTFLLNLVRNEVDRLGRNLPVVGIDEFEGFVKKIKPLYNVREKEIAIYSYLKGYIHKKVPCPYATINNPRTEIRKFVNTLESNHKTMKYSLLKSAISVSQMVKEKLKGKVKLKQCSICGEPTSSDVCKFCQIVEKIRKYLKK
jgi:uncharacterized protein (TIGR00269 family)